MPKRIVVLAAALIAVTGCTSKPGSVGSTSPSGRSSDASPVAAGLQPVKGYAEEFCNDGVPAHCPQGAVPDALRRPLQIPTVEAGATCPVSQANPRIWSRQAPGLGPGPVGPVGLGTLGILKFRPFHGSDWGGQKVLWAAAPSYDGAILIRGGRVNGDGGVGFNMNGDGPPLAELQLPPDGPERTRNNGGWRGWPSFTRVREPGCYAYQVDGTDFSYVIVFRAVPVH
jgi:hypothetical protein